MLCALRFTVLLLLWHTFSRVSSRTDLLTFYCRISWYNLFINDGQLSCFPDGLRFLCWKAVFPFSKHNVPYLKQKVLIWSRPPTKFFLVSSGFLLATLRCTPLFSAFLMADSQTLTLRPLVAPSSSENSDYYMSCCWLI